MKQVERGPVQRYPSIYVVLSKTESKCDCVEKDKQRLIRLYGISEFPMPSSQCKICDGRGWMPRIIGTYNKLSVARGRRTSFGKDLCFIVEMHTGQEIPR